MKEKRNILIIDDEVQIRRLLEISLSTYEYNTFFAENGKQGLVAAATHHPELILLDLGLPDMDGLELLVRLREWFTKPIIILSVRNSEEDIVSALDKGANDYLTKPFRSGELIARIRAAIRSGEERKDTPLLEFGDLSKRFEELCGEAGIIVRRFGNEGVRVTIAEHEGSVRLMRALDMFRDQLREE